MVIHLMKRVFIFLAFDLLISSGAFAGDLITGAGMEQYRLDPPPDGTVAGYLSSSVNAMTNPIRSIYTLACGWWCR